jgi:hypothetical protein
VRVEAGNADGLGRLDQRAPSEGSGAHHRSASTGEDKMIGCFASNVASEVLDEESGQRNLTPLVSFGRPEGHRALDRGHGLGDQYPPAQEIDPSDAECCHLPPPHSGVGQEEHCEPVFLTAGIGKLGNLLVSQEPLLCLPYARKADIGCGIDREPPVPHRVGQGHAEHPVRLPDTGRRKVEPGDPALHLSMSHGG